jgi:hypothetical protein
MRSPQFPPGAEIVRTYARYDEHVRAFFTGAYHLLMIVGRPGLAKTHAFESHLSTASHLIRGWAAPLQVYMDIYRHRDHLLIFDDAETLWKKPGGRVLLRSLSEHKPKKLMQWTSTAPQLERNGVPQSFFTSSKVAIVANRFVFGEAEEYDAVLDRGHLIVFDPSPLEVHLHVSTWFWDQEIYDHIRERLHLIEHNSARMYLKAWERKRASGDWRKLIEVAYCMDSTRRVVMALESDPSLRTVADRVKKFKEQTGASRATYFNIKRELAGAGGQLPFQRLEVPPRQLRAKPPEDRTEEEVDVEEAPTFHEDGLTGPGAEIR